MIIIRNHQNSVGNSIVKQVETDATNICDLKRPVLSKTLAPPAATNPHSRACTVRRRLGPRTK